MYRFHHLHVICNDLEAMLKLFRDTLGAKYTGARKFGGADGATLDLAGVPVYLRKAREGEKILAGPTDTHFGYNHLGLEVENLDAVYQDLQKKGYVFTSPPRDAGDNKVAFFKGPDNIMFELLQRKK